MSGMGQAAVRVDSKGRVTLPKEVRKVLGVEVGDALFLKCEPQEGQIRLAKALSPFDVLAERAMEDHQKGRTRSVEEFANENEVDL